MNNKRYQVFVSSTYSDLIEERSSIMQTLMKMDCIPAGMEHFPAADEEQWTFIKKIIDYSDYYLLIVGGRYGSLDSDGISFTEKEYDYAVSKNIKVIALLHKNPESLSFQNSEQNPESRVKLEKFIEKVKTKRLVDFWESASELPGKVALSIMSAQTMFPAIGWIRADKVTNESALEELNQLRKENKGLIEINSDLNKKISEKKLSTEFKDSLADIDSEFSFAYIQTITLRGSGKDCTDIKTATLTWKEIFSHVSPMMATYINANNISQAIADLAATNSIETRGRYRSINKQDFFTMSLQFQAYGLVKVENLPVLQGNGRTADFWILTNEGRQLMMQLRVIKA